MEELIRKSDVVKVIDKKIQNTSDYLQHDALIELEADVEEIPIVEAVPVVHGEWIRVPSSDMATGRAYECSNCKKMRYGSFLPPFCQMCGADMKKKERK